MREWIWNEVFPTNGPFETPEKFKINGLKFLEDLTENSENYDSIHEMAVR